MENFFLEAIVDDLRPRVVGASVGRVWQPDETLLVIDLRLDDGRFLAISVDPTAPALYLAAGAISAVEKRGAPDRAFAALIRKRLRGATIDAVEKPSNDRVVTFKASGFGPGGERETSRLVVELTGRTSNAYFV